MQTELPVVITPSRAELAERCERRHVVADLLCLVPNDFESPHLDFGSAIHEAVAAWWSERSQRAALDALDAAWEPSIEEDSKLTLEMARFLVRYYCSDASIAGEHWAENARWEVVACEDRVERELAGGRAKLSYKVDRLVRCVDADPPAYVLVDTKTASRVTRWWQRLWPSNLQQKAYAAAVEEHYGVKLDGHYVEGVKKSVPTEIKYVELSWPDGVKREALEHVERLAMRDAKLIAEASKTGENGEHELDREVLLELATTQTLTNGDDCYAFGRKCELYELCHETDPELRAALLDAEFEWREPHWRE